MAVTAEIVAPTAPLCDDAQLAAAGFLARYRSTTRRAYETDLRAWFRWIAARRVVVLAAKRPHIELWARHMEEAQHLAPATISRRLSTIASFYRFAAIDGYIAVSWLSRRTRWRISCRRARVSARNARTASL